MGDLFALRRGCRVESGLSFHSFNNGAKNNGPEHANHR